MLTIRDPQHVEALAISMVNGSFDQATIGQTQQPFEKVLVQGASPLVDWQNSIDCTAFIQATMKNAIDYITSNQNATTRNVSSLLSSACVVPAPHD